MNPTLDQKQKNRLFSFSIVLCAVLIVFVAALAINTFKENQYIGRSVSTSPATISVNGEGEVFAVPDTGTFSFSVVAEAKAATDAQSAAAKKTNAIIAALKGLGIDEKDIKTVDYSSYPKYDYTRTICPQGSAGSGETVTSMIAYAPCVNGKQVLTGYEVSETVSVKIRNTDTSGTVLSKVGELGATNISSLNFVIDNPDAVQAEARDKAIADAKAKAQVLSKSLGVKLVKIVSFSENGYNPYPVYYSMDAANVKAQSAPAIPDIQTGQNKITSNVMITYEIN